MLNSKFAVYIFNNIYLTSSKYHLKYYITFKYKEHAHYAWPFYWHMHCPLLLSNKEREMYNGNLYCAEYQRVSIYAWYDNDEIKSWFLYLHLNH